MTDDKAKLIFADLSSAVADRLQGAKSLEFSTSIGAKIKVSQESAKYLTITVTRPPSEVLRTIEEYTMYENGGCHVKVRAEIPTFVDHNWVKYGNDPFYVRPVESVGDFTFERELWLPSFSRLISWLRGRDLTLIKDAPPP